MTTCQQFCSSQQLCVCEYDSMSTGQRDGNRRAIGAGDGRERGREKNSTSGLEGHISSGFVKFGRGQPPVRRKANANSVPKRGKPRGGCTHHLEYLRWGVAKCVGVGIVWQRVDRDRLFVAMESSLEILVEVCREEGAKVALGFGSCVQTPLVWEFASFGKF